MIQFPHCKISGKKAQRFCINKTCNISAFICNDCPNNKCESQHKHSKVLELKKWTTLQNKLFHYNETKLSPDDIISKLSTQIDNIVNDIKQIFNNYKREVQIAYDKLNYAKEIDPIIAKLKNNDYKDFTGKDLGEFLENLQTMTHNKQKNKDEMQKSIRGNIDIIIHSMNNVKENVKDCFNLVSENKYIMNQLDFEIERYTLQIKLNPKNHLAFFNRGNAYDNARKLIQAEEDYSKAIQIYPSFAQAYLHRGNLYKKCNQIKQAFSDYKMALEINPTYLKVYYQRGILYRNLNQLQKAMFDFTKASELDPNNARIYLQKGIVHRLLDNYKQSLQNFTKAIQINPNFSEAYNNRGLLYKNFNLIAEAVEDYTKAIEVNPNNSSVYNKRGALYYGQNKFKQALVDYTKAIELNPACEDYYQNRAEVYKKLKMPEDAKKDKETLQLLKLNGLE